MVPSLLLASHRPWNNSRISCPRLCHSDERSSNNSTGWFHTT
ncbi:unnamed protein product, partial [Gulo gulo]